MLTATGKKVSVSLANINADNDYRKLYYLSFDYETTARVSDLSLSFNEFNANQVVKSHALLPADTFNTVTFDLKSSLEWKKFSKKFQLAFQIAKGQSIIIKNIRLRAPTAKEKAEEPLYLDNGVVRIGVDLTGGGSVFYFAESKTRRNLLNHADKGRFVQQSYYGAKDGSLWGTKPWNWNPVQGGGSSESGSNPAKVLEKKVTKNSLYIKSLPKHWATGEDIKDAIMEENITLNGKMAHINYTFSYKGTMVHPVRDQELPAVFVDYALPNLVFYKGNHPFTKDTLTSVVPGWPNQRQKMTESWAAYVDDQKWGIGVFVPGTTAMTTYRYSGDLTSGEWGSACSYFAPVRRFSITSGMVFTYDVYLMIDKVDKMRKAFYNLNH